MSATHTFQQLFGEFGKAGTTQWVFTVVGNKVPQRSLGDGTQVVCLCAHNLEDALLHRRLLAINGCVVHTRTRSTNTNTNNITNPTNKTYQILFGLVNDPHLVHLILFPLQRPKLAHERYRLVAQHLLAPRKPTPA